MARSNLTVDTGGHPAVQDPSRGSFDNQYNSRYDYEAILLPLPIPALDILEQ